MTIASTRTPQIQQGCFPPSRTCLHTSSLIQIPSSSASSLLPSGRGAPGAGRLRPRPPGGAAGPAGPHGAAAAAQGGGYNVVRAKCMQGGKAVRSALIPAVYNSAAWPVQSACGCIIVLSPLFGAPVHYRCQMCFLPNVFSRCHPFYAWRLTAAICACCSPWPERAGGCGGCCPALQLGAGGAAEPEGRRHPGAHPGAGGHAGGGSWCGGQEAAADVNTECTAGSPWTLGLLPMRPAAQTLGRYAP